ncbi:YwdI family protein [Bacillus kwashiorkori]|uniref:YwdI family protein n=1 Tax=Bacillus kwashiorkori TaxID=1522318 RepID=UPI000785F6C1|nr:YwdI family protein [Bacillus kwashiorkori]
MQINHQIILNKMAEKLNEALTVDSGNRVREQVQAIKTLCEVILDTHEQSQEVVYGVSNRVQPKYNDQTKVEPQTINVGKKLDTDDGANGESLFDF